MMVTYWLARINNVLSNLNALSNLISYDNPDISFIFYT